MAHKWRHPRFRHSVAASTRRGVNRERATVDPVPDRIRSIPVRAPVLPVLTGPLPGPPEPTEELDLKTSWLQESESAPPVEERVADGSIRSLSVEVAPVADVAPEKRARGPVTQRRSVWSWVGGTLAGMVVAAAGVLALAWLLA